MTKCEDRATISVTPSELLLLIVGWILPQLGGTHTIFRKLKIPCSGWKDSLLTRLANRGLIVLVQDGQAYATTALARNVSVVVGSGRVAPPHLERLLGWDAPAERFRVGSHHDTFLLAEELRIVLLRMSEDQSSASREAEERRIAFSNITHAFQVTAHQLGG